MEPSLKQRVRFERECLFSKNRKGMRKGFGAEARRKRTIFVTIRREEIPDRGRACAKILWQKRDWCGKGVAWLEQ